MRLLKLFVLALTISLCSCSIQPRYTHRAKVGPKHYTKPYKDFGKTPLPSRPSKK